MKDTLLLKAEIRKKTGTSNSAGLRRQGRIPATIYGHKEDPLSVSLDEHNLVEGLHHGARFLEVDVEGKKETVIFKDLQYDYLGRDIIHVDMMRVNVTEDVTVSVPVELKGIAIGTKEGGIIETQADSIDVT